MWVSLGSCICFVCALGLEEASYFFFVVVAVASRVGGEEGDESVTHSLTELRLTHCTISGFRGRKKGERG